MSDPLPTLLPLPGWIRPKALEPDNMWRPRRALAYLVGGMPERTADDVVATYLAASDPEVVDRILARAEAIRERDGGRFEVSYFEREPW